MRPPCPSPDAADPAGVDHVTTAAALTVSRVQALIRDLAGRHGRAGLIAALRRQAEAIAPSGVAFHQIERMALQAAADDLAWGRAPLGAWRLFFDRPPPAMAGARAAIRLRLDARCREDASLEDAVALEIERLVMAQAREAFVAARDRWSLLEAAAELQAALWDDPRLQASDEIRQRMRSGERGIRRVLARRPKLSGPVSARPPRLWRRLLMRIGARRS